MAELLKNTFNHIFLNNLSLKLAEIDKNINSKKFYNEFSKNHWQHLELKQRIRFISQVMHKHLTGTYSDKMQTIVAGSKSLPGFQSLIFPDYVQVYGLDLKNEKHSLRALKELTKYSTSEFAIRPFIIRDPEKIMETLKTWSNDKNYHVRRLSSEGSRPRLPWGQHIHHFIEDPSMIWPILYNLKADPSDYVRKSVANNLNDISKDHAPQTLAFAKKHWGKNQDTNKLLKHGLRTLLKASDTRALRVVGYNLNAAKNIKLTTNKKLNKNQNLNIKICFELTAKTTARVEIKMYFLRANGDFSQKVFKVSEKALSKGQHHIETKYKFKPITTRKYYSGDQFVSAVINGKESDKVRFNLNWK